jgi:hypothetical protein
VRAAARRHPPRTATPHLAFPALVRPARRDCARLTRTALVAIADRLISDTNYRRLAPSAPAG